MASLLAFGLIACLELRYPGPHYDELLFTNAALGVNPDTFITARFGEVPVLLMPYIGALKSYILFPVLKIWGTDILVIRGLNIVLMTLGLWLVYKLTFKFTNRLAALISLALLATNASILAFGRTDFGPIVLEFILKTSAVMAGLYFWHHKKYRYLLLSCGLLGLGLFNKLNFLWFINVFYLALAITHHQAWFQLENIRKKYAILTTLIITYMASVGYYLFISGHYVLGGEFRLQDLNYIVHSLVTTTGGQWFFNGLMGAQASFGFSYLLFGLQLALIASAGYLYWRQRPNKPPVLWIWSIVFITGLLAQIAVTANATGAWHYLSIQPFWAILVAISVSKIWHATMTRKQRGALLISVVFICSLQVSIYVKHISLFKHTRNVVWSQSIYDLADFTKSQPGHYVVADWGLQTQLLTLDPTPNKYTEVFGPIDIHNPNQVTATKQKYLSAMAGKPIYIIMHDPAVAVFPDTQAAILQIARQHGQLTLVKSFWDQGQTTFVIYKLKTN